VQSPLTSWIELKVLAGFLSKNKASGSGSGDGERVVPLSTGPKASATIEEVEVEPSADLDKN